MAVPKDKYFWISISAAVLAIVNGIFDIASRVSAFMTEPHQGQYNLTLLNACAYLAITIALIVWLVRNRFKAKTEAQATLELKRLLALMFVVVGWVASMSIINSIQLNVASNRVGHMTDAMQSRVAVEGIEIVREMIRDLELVLSSDGPSGKEVDSILGENEAEAAVAFPITDSLVQQMYFNAVQQDGNDALIELRDIFVQSRDRLQVIGMVYAMTALIASMGALFMLVSCRWVFSNSPGNSL